MFIETVPNRTSPPAILLRESYRDEAGKAQKRTLANLSKLPASLIAGLKGLLKGGVAMPTTAGSASEEGLRIERSPPRGHVARRGGGARGLFCARLVARAAAARRERAGAAASEARHAGSLRRQFILPRGLQMPAGAARLQPRPSAGPAADRLRPAVHAQRLAGGGGGVRRQYGRPGDPRRPDRQAEAALRARARGAGRRPWNVDQRPHPRRGRAGRTRLDFVPAQRRDPEAGERRRTVAAVVVRRTRPGRDLGPRTVSPRAADRLPQPALGAGARAQARGSADGDRAGPGPCRRARAGQT